MTSPSDNDKNKDAASDAKASGRENKADKFASAKETLNKVIYKTGVLAGKAFAVAKAVTKDVVQELRNVNSIRKETVATAAEGTKKTDLAKTFWTKTSGKQRGIFLGLTVIVVFVLYSALSTSGEQYLKEAHDFYKNKNYVKALELYKKSADKGYPRAFYDIGEMHMLGQGAPKNKLEAAKWFRLGAEKGDASAQTLLGVM
jgi:TPR repeat protein